MTIYPNSPLEVLNRNLKQFKHQFRGDPQDWNLLYHYLLMPLFDINSIDELSLSQKQKTRLYSVVRNNCEPLKQLLREVGYDCFFAQVEAYHQGSPSFRSRYRPHLIGDDTKAAKATASCMECLKELFCPTEGRKLPCFNLVVLIATFGETKWEIPLDLSLWVPKQHPDYLSKPQRLKQMIEALKAEADRRNLSLTSIWLSCDAAYQRSNALMKAVVDAGLTLLTKVSRNMTFEFQQQTVKAKVIVDQTHLGQMKQSGRLGWQYRYQRLVATHPVLGRVVLIVSVLYDEAHDKYRRILLMTTDLTMQATTAINGYRLRWRVEIFFKTVKQVLQLCRFQLRKLDSIRSHFQLRGLGYLLLSCVRRWGFRHRKKWGLRKVKRWLRDALMPQPTFQPA